MMFRKPLFAAVSFVFAALLAISSFVLLTGSTFGQRCARAFPRSLHEQERCVHEMSTGLRDYPTQVKEDR